MFGDFSRDSFDPSKHYTRVLMQQGRPLTDADWNRQSTVVANREWQLIRSLLRADHGTFDGGFFPVLPESGSLSFQPGSYYVDGIRCELDKKTGERSLGNEKLAVLLQAWENTLPTFINREMQDPALLGNDTTISSQTFWTLRLATPTAEGTPNNYCSCPYKVLGVDPPQKRTLSVRRVPRENRSQVSACETTMSRVSLGERLYRIEIHQSGKPVKTAPDNVDATKVSTFKWSRDNSSFATEVKKVDNSTLHMVRQGHNSGGPQTGDRIELFFANGVPASRNLPGISIQNNVLRLSQELTPISKVDDLIESAPAIGAASNAHFIRCWNHRGARQLQLSDGKFSTTQVIDQAGKYIEAALNDGALVTVTSADASQGWISIEGDLEIKFDDVWYEEGDYWLVRVSDIDPSGFAGISMKSGAPTTSEALLRTGGKHSVVLGVVDGKKWIVPNDPPNKAVAAVCWNGKLLPDHASRDAEQALSPGDPCAATIARGKTHSLAATTKSLPVDVLGPPLVYTAATPVSLLSSEGAKAIKGYFASPQDLTRRVFARHLNQKNELQSQRYKKYRSALLLSEILESSFEQYFAKVDRCLALDYAERPLVEADARADYELAMEFERTLMADDRSKSQLA